jgi:GNAT superfamily N-acetyltransferase
MKNELEISTDKSRLNVRRVHQFLCEQSYWAKGIPFATVQKSIQNSLCFGAYLNGAQVGFARVISDFATFANLVDVFILPEHRGKGYAKALVQTIMSHPDLQSLRRFTLATTDAHGLYRQFGFSGLSKPDTFMERYVPDIYGSE